MSAHALQALGYVRVSTDEQVRGFSLDHQRQVITTWCDGRGIPLAAIYDNHGKGESGKDLQRDGLEEVDVRIQQGGIGYVVISKIDRLSRSLADTSRLLDRWGQAGVVILAPEDGIVDPSLSGRMLPLIFGWMAEQERSRILNRIEPGIKARFAAGLPHGRVPFGYRIAATQTTQRPDKCLQPHPTQAPIITALFHTAAEQDLGAQALARWLQQHHPEYPITPRQLRRLLTNPIYIGTISAVFTNHAGQREPLLRMNNHPALVPQEVFVRVQEQIRRRAREQAQGLRLSSGTSWLGGIATCAHCGAKVTARQLPATNEQVYECSSRSHGPGCGAGRVPAEAVHTMVLHSLYHSLEHLGRPLIALAQDAVETIPTFLDHQRDLAALTLQGNEQALAQLDAALEEGALSAAAYDQETARIEQRLVVAQQQLDRVDGLTYLAQLIKAREPEQQGRTSARRWLTFPEAFAQLTRTERRRLVAAAAQRLAILQEEPPFCDCVWATDAQAFALMATGMSRAWAATGGHAVPEEHLGITTRAVTALLGDA